MSYKNLSEGFRIFVEDCMNICDNLTIILKINKNIYGEQAEKCFSVLNGEKLSDSSKMTIINKFYHLHRNNIISSESEKNWLAGSNVELILNEKQADPSKIYKISLSKIYDLTISVKNMDEPIVKLLNKKFLGSFYSLLSCCSMSEPDRDILHKKLIQLEYIQMPSEGNSIFSFARSLFSGDLKNGVNNFLSQENINIVKEFTQNLIGENKIMDKIVEKFDDNKDNPLHAFTSIINDKDLINETIETVKNLGDSSMVTDFKNGLENVVESIQEIKVGRTEIKELEE